MKKSKTNEKVVISNWNLRRIDVYPKNLVSLVLGVLYAIADNRYELTTLINDAKPSFINVVSFLNLN